MTTQVTFAYSDPANRYSAARFLYERFCQQINDDPNRAMTQLTAGIQSALGQAYSQGVSDTTSKLMG